MSYFIHAFLRSSEPPSATGAKEYLLEGALFDTRPQISVHTSPDGSFETMELDYHPNRRPIVLRQLFGEEAEGNRAEAIDVATVCNHPEIAAELEAAKTILKWEVERSELDEDAWFAIHLWQVWILGPSKGWLYAPGDGLFDAELKRRCRDR